MSNKLKSTIEERNRIHAEMQGIYDLANKENRELTPEESQKWDDMDAEWNKLNKRFEDEQKLEERKRKMADDKFAEDDADAGDGKSKKPSKEENEARTLEIFDKYLRRGYSALTAEESEFMHKRQNVTSTPADGGYLVPQGYSNELEMALKEYDGLRNLCRIYSTPMGNDVPWPTQDETSQLGELVTEGIATNEQKMTFGSKTLKSFMFSSKVILVSQQLLQDSAFNLNEHTMNVAAERIGRIQAQYHITGNGTTQPEGLQNASLTNVAANAPEAITRNDILDLIHSVDRSYRKSKSAALVMNDTTLKAIKKLSMGTADDRPLWVPSMRDGEPSKIEGFKYEIVSDVADIAASGISMYFGDWSKFIIRDVQGTLMMRLIERYAERALVGFIVWHRSDSRYLGNGIAKLTHPAT